MRNIVLLIFGILYCCIYVRYQMIADPYETSIARLGMSAMLTILTFPYLMVLAHHINFLEIVRAKKVSIFRVCFYGLLAVAPPTIFGNFPAIKKDDLLISLVLLLAVFLLIFGRALFIALVDVLPDLQIITQPPRYRADILPLDAMLLFMFAMPFLAKIFH